MNSTWGSVKDQTQTLSHRTVHVYFESRCKVRYVDNLSGLDQVGWQFQAVYMVAYRMLLAARRRALGELRNANTANIVTYAFKNEERKRFNVILRRVMTRGLISDLRTCHAAKEAMVQGMEGLG